MHQAILRVVEQGDHGLQERGGTGARSLTRPHRLSSNAPRISPGPAGSGGAREGAENHGDPRQVPAPVMPTGVEHTTKDYTISGRHAAERDLPLQSPKRQRALPTFAP